MFPKQQLRFNGKRPQLLSREPSSNNITDRKKELEEIASKTLTKVIDSVDDKLVLEKLDSFQMRQFTEQIYDTLVAVLEESSLHLSQSDKQKVIQYVCDEIFGYGPINSLLDDPAVTEIMVNGYDNVYVERDGRIAKTEVTFRNNEHVLHVINKIITPLGRRIDESSPTVDARLPDGSRVNAIIPPLALKGPSLTIRKFAADPFTVEDLLELGTMTEEMVMFLKACVRSRVNIIVSGGTGSGKTTTLNVLSSFIPDHERIITIEDTAELQLQQDHVVTLESRPANIEGRGQYTIRELVINSLRMRPDRIVVGEVRGAETLDMLQAMNTGHDGSISTLHANNPREALTRMETMVLMAGMDLPLPAVREQISSAIELIIQQSRFSDGTRKITRISEVVGMEKDHITLQDIFVFQQDGLNESGMVQGEHKYTGTTPRCIDKLRACGEADCIESLQEKYRAQQPCDQEEVEEKEPPVEPLAEEAKYLHEDDGVAGSDEMIGEIKEKKDLEDMEDMGEMEEMVEMGEMDEADETDDMDKADALNETSYMYKTSYAVETSFSGAEDDDTDTDYMDVKDKTDEIDDTDDFVEEVELKEEVEKLNNAVDSDEPAEVETDHPVKTEGKEYFSQSRSEYDRQGNREKRLVLISSAVRRDISVGEQPSSTSSPPPPASFRESNTAIYPREELLNRGATLVEPLPVREAEEEQEVEEEVADEVKNEVRDEQRENEVDPPLAETNPERNLSSLIPKKMRGISIPVNKLSGLSRYMNCGARVDVLVAIDRGNGEPPAVYTAAKNAVVLSSGEAEEETGEYQTAVTLAVYPEEAEALVGACYRGLFHLTLCPDNECSSMD